MTHGSHSTTADITGAGPEPAISNREILDGVDEGILALDTSRRITFMNMAARRMIDRASGDNRETRSPPAFIDELRADNSPWSAGSCPIQATLADGESRDIAHNRFRQYGGGSLPVSYRCVALRATGGVIQGVILTFRKIAGHIAERRYRALIAATSDVIWTSTADARLVDISDAWLELVGITMDEARDWGWADVVPPRTGKRVYAPGPTRSATDTRASANTG